MINFGVTILGMENLISIAKILNFHGIKGEARVGFTKGHEEQISALKKVFAGAQRRELNVKGVRFHKNFAIIKFAELNSIDELLEFKGENLYIPKKVMAEGLAEDEFLIGDLIGMAVFDDKEDFVGTVQSVGGSAANDILCIKPENPDYEKFLIPFVKELVPVVDIAKRKIIIKPIEGLLG